MKILDISVVKGYYPKKKSQSKLILIKVEFYSGLEFYHWYNIILDIQIIVDQIIIIKIIIIIKKIIIYFYYLKLKKKKKERNFEGI